MNRTKLTKTESRLLETLESRGSVTPDGLREVAAARKLVAKGIAYVSHTHRGCVYSRHGYGQAAYSRPNYYATFTLRLVNQQRRIEND